MLKKSVLLAAALCVLAPAFAQAATTVVEGDDAKKLYEAEKATAPILIQKDKNFTLSIAGVETAKPTEMKVKAGQHFFIVNQEAEYVHNVYDESDAGWVLKKQEPGNVAAVSFDAAGEHKLRCAIHPQMRVTAIVQ